MTTSDATPSLQVVLATPPEKRARDALAHEAWGQRLTAPQFVDREAWLRLTPFAEQAMQTWLLVQRGDADRRALASLETFEMSCRHGPRAGRAFEIASVYTEHALRGRGHATQLLQLVAEELGRRPSAQAMTLYSDVGAAIYERAGFVARPAFDWVIPVAREEVSAVARVDGDAAVAAVLAAHPPRGRFAIFPSFEHVAWQRARERIYAGLLDRPGLANGVLACEGGHALLCADLKLERALVLAWWATDAATAARLCAAAADEAARAGLTQLVAWAAPDVADEAPFAQALPWLGATRCLREGSIPMLRALPGARGLVSDAWREIPRALWV